MESGVEPPEVGAVTRHPVADLEEDPPGRRSSTSAQFLPLSVGRCAAVGLGLTRIGTKGKIRSPIWLI